MEDEVTTGEAPIVGDPDPGEIGDSDPTTGTPQAIPYNRFKEVNDRRKAAEEALEPYRALEQLGYTAENIRQLIEWEQAFNLDPSANWMAVAKSLPNMPESVLRTIEETMSNGNTQTPPKPDEPKSDEAPAWAKPLLDDYQNRQKREEDSARDEQLKRVMDAWREKDQEDGIKGVSERMMLRAIAFTDGETIEEVLEQARGAFLEDRESLLGDVVKDVKKSREGLPTPIPGEGAAPGNPAPPPQTLQEASSRALAAWDNLGGE